MLNEIAALPLILMHIQSARCTIIIGAPCLSVRDQLVAIKTGLIPRRAGPPALPAPSSEALFC